MPFLIREHGPEWTFGVQVLHFGALKLSTVICGLALNRRAEIIPGNAVRKTGKVFDLFDADQVAAGNVGFEHEGRKPMACGEQAGGEAGKAGARYYDVIIGHDLFVVSREA